MSITHISGKLMVLVDKVDVEQICMEKPDSTKGFSIAVQAMIAALEKEDVKNFQRQIAKSNHILFYLSTQFGKEDYLVVFSIKQKSIDAIS